MRCFKCLLSYMFLRYDSLMPWSVIYIIFFVRYRLFSNEIISFYIFHLTF